MERWGLTPEASVMLRPASAFRQLAGAHHGEGSLAALGRPLFFALVFGCMVSLVASQRLTVRHVAGGAVSGSLFLVCQVAALAAVCRRPRELPFLRTLDLFFMGYGPWALWMLGFSAVWALTPLASSWGGLPAIIATASVAAIWSGYIDFRFFEQALRRSPVRAVWDVVLFRAIAWSAGIVLFGGGSLLPEFAKVFSR
jgi:hypothetical protein